MDRVLISHVIKGGDKKYAELLQHGIGQEHFDQEFRKQWQFIARTKKQHGHVPDRTLFKERYPRFRLVKVNPEQVPSYLDYVKKRARYGQLIEVIDSAAKRGIDIDNVDTGIEDLITQLSNIYMQDKHHIVDVFGKQFSREILADQRQRAKTNGHGSILTGLTRFDEATKGIHRKDLMTVLGRVGKGKSWLSLLFLKNALAAGNKCLLYPLEMGIEDVMYRLYILFCSDLCQDPRYDEVPDFIRKLKTVRNTEMMRGHVDIDTFKKFLRIVNSEYEGKLLAADVTKTRFAYTPERVAADIEMYQPDFVVIDYLTLLKKRGGGPSTDWQIIQEMTSTLKTLAMQYDICVQINVQANRQASKNNANIFLPRPEHIAFGDSIAHDSDVIISMNREDNALYYALVKNRHGREFGKTHVLFNPDQGELIEMNLDEEAAMLGEEDE